MILFVYSGRFAKSRLWRDFFLACQPTVLFFVAVVSPAWRGAAIVAMIAWLGALAWQDARPGCEIFHDAWEWFVIAILVSLTLVALFDAQHRGQALLGLIAVPLVKSAVEGVIEGFTASSRR